MQTTESINKVIALIDCDENAREYARQAEPFMWCIDVIGGLEITNQQLEHATADQLADLLTARGERLNLETITS